MLHIHNPTLSLIGLLLKLAFPRLKIVGNLHTDRSFLKAHHRLGVSLLARISHHFICVSRACAASIPEAVRGRLSNNERLSVILNGIDSRLMAEYVLRHKDKLQFISGHCMAKEKVAIVVARMVPAKNCLFVLRLLSETPSIDRMIWFGDGSLRKVIEVEIDRLGLGSRIEIKGNRPRSEVFQALVDASLYISASKWEGIGVATLEAAALGCWPVLSDIPAHKEIADLLDI
ncbi:MAG: glycosyltransferase [Spirochaetales bacterium]|nr:glycosyltransferase [Spirochaetales bacterium]